MDPITAMNLAGLAISMLEELAPKIKALFDGGQISAEQQKSLKDRLDALSGSETFSGPEWQVEK